MARKTQPASSEPKIYTNESAPQTIVINVGFPTVMGHVGDGDDIERNPVRISFTDAISRELFAEVSLTPAQFVSLVRGGNVEVVADHYTRHPERIGKRSQNTSTAVTAAYGEDIGAKAEAVRQQYLADGWEQVNTHKTNTGQTVVARRWIDA